MSAGFLCCTLMSSSTCCQCLSFVRCFWTSASFRCNSLLSSETSYRPKWRGGETKWWGQSPQTRVNEYSSSLGTLRTTQASQACQPSYFEGWGTIMTFMASEFNNSLGNAVRPCLKKETGGRGRVGRKRGRDIIQRVFAQLYWNGI